MRPHDGLDEGWRERVALHLLGALPGSEAVEVEAHIASCSACRQEADSLRSVVDALAFAGPTTDPPESLKQRLLDRIRTKEPVQPWKAWTGEVVRQPLLILKKEEGAWEPTAVEGVAVRRLFVDPEADRVTMLVRMTPGASYPSHRHAGVEECYVLEGDLYSHDFEMRAGDYQRLDGGSVHGVQATRQGCLLFIVSSLHDELLSAQA
jgi:anti-sigma factor ChrR (cupin superfamily)